MYEENFFELQNKDLKYLCLISLSAMTRNVFFFLRKYFAYHKYKPIPTKTGQNRLISKQNCDKLVDHLRNETNRRNKNLSHDFVGKF